MGDARGRFEGDTLIVETTNFTNRTHFGYNNRYNSEKLKLVERFTPIGPGKLNWEVTVNDPEVWTRPWTFAMTLTKDDTQPIFEYACHEGNYGLRDILSGARSTMRSNKVLGGIRQSARCDQIKCLVGSHRVLGGHGSRGRAPYAITPSAPSSRAKHVI